MSSAPPSSIVQPQNLDEPQTFDVRVPFPDRTGSATSTYSRSNSTCSLARQPSSLSLPSSSFGCSLSRFLTLQKEFCHTQKGIWLLGFISNCVPGSERKAEKRKGGIGRRDKVVQKIGLLLGLLFLVNLVMLLRIQHRRLVGFRRHSNHESPRPGSGSSVPVVKGETTAMLERHKKPRKGTLDRLLALAAHALAENKREPKDLWHEPYVAATSWKPCADMRTWELNGGNNGYVMVTANGGMNQQRVAVCNAVVVARLLNSTLVIPKFMYSSVWRDVSQFSDIYQEDYFMNFLSGDVRIEKELPEDLKSLDLEAIGSVVTDVDIGKESKPSFYLKHILPILLKNRVVHFVGFGNRLAFDPIPFQLQRLRCRCNFHALQFVPKIQQTAALLLQRLRKDAAPAGPMDHHLIGSYSEPMVKGQKGQPLKSSRYLALHLRFEIDMVAHSLCEYGGGDEERRELEAYRQIHFPALAVLTKTKKLPSPAALRGEGLCPLSPEEAVLMLAALGFTRKTQIFVAGADIYGGSSRLTALTSLYPHLVTKEKLLSANELEPFTNFSSQLAALDFIACTASDAFAMTDSGSQLSSLVSGFRIYYGEGKMTTIRPNKRRIADIFLKNNTIEWRVFEQRLRKAVRQTKHVFTRPKARSVYRYPRCKECMCYSGF